MDLFAWILGDTTLGTSNLTQHNSGSENFRNMFLNVPNFRYSHCGGANPPKDKDGDSSRSEFSDEILRITVVSPSDCVIFKICGC